MQERTFGQKVDRYLRNEDTLIARTVDKICPLEGTEYRQSRFKNGFERTVAAPVALVAAPVSLVLGMAAKLEDGGDMFYIPERVGRGGEPINVYKIRTMLAGSHSVDKAIKCSARYKPEEDPRNTKVGKLLRSIDFDELPQFIQVVIGDLSLVDVRSAPEYVFDYLENVRPEDYEVWREAYLAGKPGILNLNTAMRSRCKDDARRTHYDIFYSRHASLGLDLYIIYRTASKMGGKIKRKIGF